MHVTSAAALAVALGVTGCSGTSIGTGTGTSSGSSGSGAGTSGSSGVSGVVTDDSEGTTTVGTGDDLDKADLTWLAPFQGYAIVLRTYAEDTSVSIEVRESPHDVTTRRYSGYRVASAPYITLTLQCDGVDDTPCVLDTSAHFTCDVRNDQLLCASSSGDLTFKHVEPAAVSQS